MRRRRRRCPRRASHHAIEKADRFTCAPTRATSTRRRRAGDRRPVDSQDGRDRLRPRHGRRFGLEITETRPALVPLTAEVPELAGVSLEVVARCGKARSARPCCSPIAACRAGDPADLVLLAAGQEIAIDLLPTSMPATS
jgi:hypothetical protein